MSDPYQRKPVPVGTPYVVVGYPSQVQIQPVIVRQPVYWQGPSQNMNRRQSCQEGIAVILSVIAASLAGCSILSLASGNRQSGSPSPPMSPTSGHTSVYQGMQGLLYGNSTTLPFTPDYIWIDPTRQDEVSNIDLTKASVEGRIKSVASEFAGPDVVRLDGRLVNESSPNVQLRYGIRRVDQESGLDHRELYPHEALSIFNMSKINFFAPSNLNSPVVTYDTSGVHYP